MESPYSAGRGGPGPPPAYLVALHVAGVGEVDDWAGIGATEAIPEEVLCQQGADIGLASAGPAMQRGPAA